MDRGELSRGRKLTAALGMLATAGGLGYVAFDSVRPSFLMLAFAALTAVSGVGLTRGSVLTQVLARGVAWLVLFPSLVYLVASVLFGHVPEMAVVAFAAATGTALLAARPSLTTAAARAEFAPHAWRRLFLTGATTAASSSIALGGVALAQTMSTWGSALTGMGFAALAAGLLASVVGVLRMRAWGVLLGGLMSLVFFAVGAFGPSHAALGWGLLAMPTLLGFLGPLLLARLGVVPSSSPPVMGRSRVAPEDPTRVRVALYEPTDEHDEHAGDEAAAALGPRKLVTRV